MNRNYQRKWNRPFPLRDNPLITGTLLLTLTGFASRLIGFFYRSFLSKTFGEEGMGIYQLISPVMALSFSLTAAGIQTAISKYVASETSTKDYRTSLHVLITGAVLSLPLSILCTCIIYHFSDFISIHFLMEKRTAPLLRIFSFSIPLSAIHSLANGYFYGIKKTSLPAATQIVEQVARVGSVFLLCRRIILRGETPGIGCAAAGLALGEACAILLSLFAIYLRFSKLEVIYPGCLSRSRSADRPGCLMRSRSGGRSGRSVRSRFRHDSGRFVSPGLLRKMFLLAAPLSANRLVINFLQSMEAVYLPVCLMRHGMSNSQALSVYGVLTGMALPLILFPSALINSFCVLLLPVISEADLSNNHSAIRRAVRKSTICSSIFGVLCTFVFLLFGNLAGIILFGSKMAGSFILTLSFICPFLYLSGTMSSILHGLGHTVPTFCFSVIALVIRLLFTFFLVPAAGINGYLWGLLLSQLLMTFLNYSAVRRYT